MVSMLCPLCVCAVRSLEYELPSGPMETDGDGAGGAAALPSTSAPGEQVGGEHCANHEAGSVCRVLAALG